MPRKCRGCLCRTCKEVCRCKECKGRIKECKDYIACRQLNIFIQKPKATPRYSWNYYGISKERYHELSDMIRSDRYASVTKQVAHTANEMLSEYILLSVTKNLSYEDIAYVDGLGRIPCGRTDFYGWRRYFISLFDKEMRKIGK